MTYESLQSKIAIRKSEIRNAMIKYGKTEEEVIKIEETIKKFVKEHNEEINRIYA